MRLDAARFREAAVCDAYIAIVRLDLRCSIEIGDFDGTVVTAHAQIVAQAGDADIRVVILNAEACCRRH